MLRYLHDVHSGRVDPRTIGLRLNVPADPHDFAAQLRSAVVDRRLVNAVSEMRPPLAQYQALRGMLTRYRALSAGRPLEVLPPAAAVHPGERYAGLGVLQRQLVALGDLRGVHDEDQAALSLHLERLDVRIERGFNVVDQVNNALLAFGRKGLGDVGRAERIVPQASPVTAGCAVIGPDRFIDDVPGMQPSGVTADRLLDVLVKQALDLAAREGAGPGRAVFVPDQRVAADQQAVVAGGEQGLLGFALPPDTATSGRFFVNFTNRSGDTVVARFRRSSPVVADIGSSSSSQLRLPG
jgi:hypothetical protein